ncbi:MAG: hypothetical protein WCH46_11300, partial [bacterium]
MLLANLVRTLSTEEIQKIRKEFQLSERSRMLFERIASDPTEPPDSDSLTKAFRISKENLYRLCSEIVDEAIRILAKREEFASLKFYLDKFLFRPFITELRRLEKQLLRENNSESLERLYEFGFKNSMAFPVSVLDLKITEEIGMKWIRI